MILVIVILFVIASFFVTHYTLVEDYCDKKDVIFTYLTSMVVFGLFGFTIGYIIDLIWSFL